MAVKTKAGALKKAHLLASDDHPVVKLQVVPNQVSEVVYENPEIIAPELKSGEKSEGGEGGQKVVYFGSKADKAE
ncbi:MAG: hypothetical protein ACKVJU_13925 [Verrucomicrobiales bacterium]